MNKWTVGAVLLTAAASVSLNGCVVMASSTTSFQGNRRFVGPETLNQVQSGNTTKDRVLATLGQPTDIAKASEDTEILHYKYVETKRDSVAVLVLIAANNTTKDQRDLYFEVRDGIVQKYWQTRDRSR